MSILCYVGFPVGSTQNLCSSIRISQTVRVGSSNANFRLENSKSIVQIASRTSETLKQQ